MFVGDTVVAVVGFVVGVVVVGFVVGVAVVGFVCGFVGYVASVERWGMLHRDSRDGLPGFRSFVAPVIEALLSRIECLHRWGWSSGSLDLGSGCPFPWSRFSGCCLRSGSFLGTWLGRIRRTLREWAQVSL